MKIWKLLYMGMGVVLAAGSIVTGEYGLSQVNREIYETAVSLDSDMQAMGFEDFSIRDYKIRFYSGNCDYVVKNGGVNDRMTITKEKAVLDVFAGTALEVNGEYQVLLPTYEQFKGLFDVLDTAGTISEGMSEGTLAFTENSYSENSHVATIWHEAFHAWQWQENNWKPDIDALMERIGDGIVNDREEFIVNEVDSKKEMVTVFEQEMKLLKEAYGESDKTRKKELLAQALEIADERENCLTDAANAMEFYLENLEGSAMYIEGMAYRKLEGNAAWEENYMGEFSYENGSGKYYYMGMLKCLLLDEMMPGWQSRFSGTHGLNELLAECTE